MGFFKSLMSVISTDGKTGTPFNFDKNHTVYFKGTGVTKEDAARVAGFFQGYGYFRDDNQSDVQIAATAPGGGVKVGMIIGGKLFRLIQKIILGMPSMVYRHSFPVDPYHCFSLTSIFRNCNNYKIWSTEEARICRHFIELRTVC